MKIKRDDTVVVITGRDKGKQGKVRQSLPKRGCVVVEGINTGKRHTRPRGQARQAGIIDRDAPMPISNVMLVCPKCNKPTRVSYTVVSDGSRMRMCHRCNEVID